MFNVSAKSKPTKKTVGKASRRRATGTMNREGTFSIALNTWRHVPLPSLPVRAQVGTLNKVANVPNDALWRHLVRRLLRSCSSHLAPNAPSQLLTISYLLQSFPACIHVVDSGPRLETAVWVTRGEQTSGNFHEDKDNWRLTTSQDQ